MLYYLIQIAQGIAGHTPRRIRWWVGESVAQAIYWGWVEKRIATQKNMSVILDLPVRHPVVRLAARLSWRNYGRFIADFFDLPNHPSSYYLGLLNENSELGLQAIDAIDAMRGRGQGVMLTTGHYGSWDAAGVMVASRGSDLGPRGTGLRRAHQQFDPVTAQSRGTQYHSHRRFIAPHDARVAPGRGAGGPDGSPGGGR